MYCKRSDHDAVYIFKAFEKTLSKYEQINERSSSVNAITDSCVETLIPENDDFFLKSDTLSIRTQTNKKSARGKGPQYKDASIRNKFTQTINVITYKTTSTQTMPQSCTCLESRGNDNSKSGIKRAE